MMASTRAALEQIEDHLDESMGVRNGGIRPKLSPIASQKDVGRRPLRTFGSLQLNMLIPDPEQPRSEFSQESIQDLAQSIRDKGQFHPIRVRWSDERSKWIIMSGERRYRAAQAAGLKTVDCFFQSGEISSSQILEQQLVENLLREDLKPMEQARGFANLMELNDWNGKQVAEALHVSQAKVSRALALLDLPESIQASVNEGTLAARSAYELSKLPREETQAAIAGQGTEDLTHKKIHAAVKQRKGKPKGSRGFKQTFFADHGIKVTVQAPKKITYDQVEIALRQATEEVQHYLDQGRTAL